MSNPATLVTRVFRFGSRFMLFKNTRTPVFLYKTLYHSHIIIKPDICGLSYVLSKNDARIRPVRAMSALSPSDPSSYSRPEQAVIKHVGLNLNIDFDKKVLVGSALLKFEALQNIDEVILDASSQTIKAVELENGTALKYKLDGHIANFGSKLTIYLPKTVSPAEKKERNEDERKMAPSVSRTLSKARSKVILLDNNDFVYKIPQSQSLDMNTNKAFVIEPDNEGCCQECRCEDTHKDRKRQSASKSNSEKQFKTQIDSLSFDQGNSGRRLSGPRMSENPNNGRFAVRVEYTTDPSASALQWLEPSQTSGKQHPYLFSQCQPIHARSILPCQDTPSVKFTYDAEVTAPPPFTVLMSALTKDRDSNRTTFHQPVPIPSYLLAIAVGVLEHRSIGPRTTVWSEKEEIERSAWEFAETENYLQAAERLCGPYVWEQYDLLVLPPSFPYGGMENPCLTFVTPTLLAGDRSQADVIVHEIMHSWTGNLVTNRNFEHFWLNEGFTVFLERKVAASLISSADDAKRSRDFHSLLGLQELTEAVTDELGVDNPLTKLVVNLTEVHPDDAFSTVPYEKGSLFLRYLEDLFGVEVFDDFLRSYLNNFQRRSLDTDQFKAYLLGYFTGKPAADKLALVQWEQWLYSPGMPPAVPDYDTSMTKAITHLLEKIESEAVFSAEDVKSFTPHQLIHLLQELLNRRALPTGKLEELGAAYKVADTQNSEIRYRWLRLCVKSRVSSRVDEVLEFVNQQGRMKFVRPLYRELYAWEEQRARAVDNFLAQEPRMMHVAAYTVRKDLHLSENLLAHQ